MRHPLLLVTAATALAWLGTSTPAAACGGCFHEPPNPNETPSLVTDHRMAFSISKTRTILWDQVRYAGDPKEFAWVLPVRAGTEVEVGRDEFLNALDTVTAPTVAPPIVQCYYPTPASGGGGGGGFGCGSTASDFSPPNASAGIDAAVSADAGVVVVSEKVVGPYETVIVRANDGQAISDWLVAHNFVIPSAIVPIIAYYTNKGFDFVAIRLQPNVGTRAMQPIRIVSPGADGTLPLRMVSAGIGATVGLELFVISEGRYEATSFENALMDPTAVKWDGANRRSTYAEAFNGLVASHPNGVWVTEYAGKSTVSTLKQLYGNACFNQPPVQVPCPTSDAGSSDAGPSDAGADASDGGCFQSVPACSVFDDVTRATSELYGPDTTITRMRASLGASALGTDLVVGAAKSQQPVASLIQTTQFTDPKYNPCPGGSTTPYAPADQGDGCTTAGSDGRSTAVAGLGLVALLAIARRRRR